MSLALIFYFEIRRSIIIASAPTPRFNDRTYIDTNSPLLPITSTSLLARPPRPGSNSTEAGSIRAVTQPPVDPSLDQVPSDGQLTREGAGVGQIEDIELDPVILEDLNREEQPSCSTGWRKYDWDNLPSFIEPISTPLSRATADYLAANEAFSFPASDATRSALINGFIRFVYPLYPMFDLADLEALASNSPVDGLRTHFTVLTFQAMLLAAIPVYRATRSMMLPEQKANI